MANNYLLFSEFIPVKDQKQQAWIAHEIEHSLAGDDDDMSDAPCCLWEIEADGVWVHSDESGDVDALCDVVSRWMQTFGIKEPWTMEWAETCSKPRINEFGGGAAVVYPGSIDFFSTGNWVRNRLANWREWREQQ